MKEKVTISYFMHVAWRHIFQRPHILYLKLEQDFECTLIERVHIKNYKMPKQGINPKKMKSILQLPRTGKSRVMRTISDFYTKLLLGNISSDIIWICHPEQYKDIPRKYKGKVIYDCMDNYACLGPLTSRLEVQKNEKKLIERADLIFVSSKKLFENINKPEKTTIIRNGYMKSDESMPIKHAEIKKQYSMIYFGTVSSWFDFDTISASLDSNDNVSYEIIGPVSKEIDTSTLNSKIHFSGPVEHSRLADHVKNADALIMPFVVNDIILAVDPVKLYEYINMGKCIISVWYPEIDRFEPFVYFYKTKEEYCELIQELSNTGFKPKYNEEQRKVFLEANSWEARYEEIRRQIFSII